MRQKDAIQRAPFEIATRERFGQDAQPHARPYAGMDRREIEFSAEIDMHLYRAVQGDVGAYRKVLVWATAQARQAAPSGSDPEAFAALVLARLHRARTLFRRTDDAALFLDALIGLELRSRSWKRMRPPPLAKGAAHVTSPGV